MRLRALRDACLGGFLYGALLYGAVLSLVHGEHVVVQRDVFERRVRPRPIGAHPPPLQRPPARRLFDCTRRAVERIDNAGSIDGATHEAVAPSARAVVIEDGVVQPAAGVPQSGEIG